MTSVVDTVDAAFTPLETGVLELVSSQSLDDEVVEIAGGGGAAVEDVHEQSSVITHVVEVQTTLGADEVSRL